MVYKKTSVREQYFIEQEKYTSIYGDRTIVFFQIGTFYEAYCNSTQGYADLARLEALLGMKYNKRDDQPNKTGHMRDNNFGIPCVSIQRNLTTMVETGYTIVLFDQTSNDEEALDRVCIGVFSKGTYLSDRMMRDANYLLTAYIAEEPQLSGKKSLMAIGVTLVDVTIGTNVVHEFYSSKLDEKFGLDELTRIMQIYNPTELVVYYKPIIYDKKTIQKIKLYLELGKYKNSYFYVYHDDKGSDQLDLLNDAVFNVKFQNEYLSRIFELANVRNLSKKKSALEFLNLDRKYYATISAIIMLKYIEQHNVLLLKNLSYPEIYLYHKHLILGNNAIEQLNIIDANGLEYYNNKFKSVFDVVNQTITPMGRRFLRESLINPESQQNRSVIKARYDMIEALTTTKLYSKIQCHLKNIMDVERLHRKISMGIIVPYDFYRLDSFYQATTKIFACIKDNPVLNQLVDRDTIKNFMTWQIKYNKIFDFERMRLYKNYTDIENSFFRPGVFDDIDTIQEKIDYVNSMIGASVAYFKDLIGNRCKKIGVKDVIQVENNLIDGYFFSITKTNEKVLKAALKGKTTIRIDLSVGQTLQVRVDDITFKSLKKGRSKIFIAPLVEHTTNLSSQIEKLKRLIKKKFVRTMLDFYSTYKQTMHDINRFIAMVDFLVSGAVVAEKYCYCKPSIPSDTNVPSYLSARGLRHVVIERLCEETEYIPNDIDLGNVPLANSNKKISINHANDSQEKNGVILYGLNSAGKTVLIKAIGIAIILAQIGYYVPAMSFTYEPYMAVYSRITGNDNMLKGLSSFALEMTEVDSIFVRNINQGPYTLVIGDEVCRGTEHISALAIVSSALVELSVSKCSFILSSHLHEILDQIEVQSLKNLRVYHLRVEYDEQNDCLVFDRKLTPGSGPSVYGLIVAKYLVKNSRFISRAEIIKKRLLAEEKFDIPIKVSNYNKDLIVSSCCICHYRPMTDLHRELESHHIHFQKDCLTDGKIKEKPYLHKNKMYNLVVLCRKCHTKVHRGEIIINGYKDTSIGALLDYHFDIKKNFSKEIAKFRKMENDKFSNHGKKSNSIQCC